MSNCDEACNKLAVANRILAHEGVLDGFGHVSMRHPADPTRYLLARSRSPELIQPGDILNFTSIRTRSFRLPVFSTASGSLHGCIYQARPDVHAVCQSLPRRHAFLHLGRAAATGGSPRCDDGRHDPLLGPARRVGDTDLIVAKPEEGASLARALRPELGSLDEAARSDRRGHLLEELVFRSVFSCRNPRCSGRRRCWAASAS